MQSSMTRKLPLKEQAIFRTQVIIEESETFTSTLSSLSYIQLKHGANCEG